VASFERDRATGSSTVMTATVGLDPKSGNVYLPDAKDEYNDGVSRENHRLHDELLLARRALEQTTMAKSAARQRKGNRDLAMAIFLAIVTLVLTYFLKLTLAFTAYVLALVALAEYVGNLEVMVGVKRAKLLALQTAIIVLGTGIGIPVFYRFWREEKASLLEVNLRGAHERFADGKIRGYPFFQVGDSESIFIATPDFKGDPYFKPFPDAEIRLQFGRQGPLVSTTVRDGQGHIVATIDENHWMVYPPYCTDKNYTADGLALEVLDSSLHVVLQLKILPDRVQVQGEWWDNQGHGLRFLKSPDSPKNGMVAALGPRDKKNELLIKSMFRYPSKHHWQELVH